MVTEDDVRRIALSFPATYERESYGGRPSWRTKPRMMFTWIRDEPDAIVVWVDSIEAKESLLASDPRKFFTTSHYDDHPVVLVRFEEVDVNELTELICDSWALRAPRSLTKEWRRGSRPAACQRPNLAR